MTATVIRDALCIQIHNNGEYGTFFVRTGEREASWRTTGEKGYWCELTIQSGFGNVAYHWGNMGCPAHEFLKTDKHYLMNKLFGDRAYVFDFDATIRALKLQLIEQRRENWEVTKQIARERWDAITSLEHTQDTGYYMHQFLSSNALSEWYEPCDVPQCTILNPQAEGLWEHLWPEFLQALTEEMKRRETPNVQPIR